MTYHMDFKFSQSVYDFPREEAQCFVKDVKQKVLHMHFQVNTNLAWQPHSGTHIVLCDNLCLLLYIFVCVN